MVVNHNARNIVKIFIVPKGRKNSATILKQQYLEASQNIIIENYLQLIEFKDNCKFFSYCQLL